MAETTDYLSYAGGVSAAVSELPAVPLPGGRRWPCPACREETGVRLDTKEAPAEADVVLPKPAYEVQGEILRTHYYYCENCQTYFTTKEILVVPQMNWIVERALKVRERFDLAKILASLGKATRKVSAKDLWKITQDVAKILGSKHFPPIEVCGKNERVYTTEQVGEAVLISLLVHGRPAAWIRYSLVYFSLEDEGDFFGLIDILHKKYRDHMLKAIEYSESPETLRRIAVAAERRIGKIRKGGKH